MRKETYRLKIVYQDGTNTATYIFRSAGQKVRYISAMGTPLALANLVGDQATELSFQLDDAPAGDAAFKAVNAALDRLWAGNKPMQPKVELL